MNYDLTPLRKDKIKERRDKKKNEENTQVFAQGHSFSRLQVCGAEVMPATLIQDLRDCVWLEGLFLKLPDRKHYCGNMLFLAHAAGGNSSLVSYRVRNVQGVVL